MTAFWDRVDRSAGLNECWPWTASVFRKGYGSVRVKGRTERAHRHAWALVFGPVPDGLFVLHRCDNPRCCNPAHLFLGTNQDNVRDMVAKGRQGPQNRPAEVCRAGLHPLTPENRVRAADGRRRCRACVSAYARRRYASQLLTPPGT